MWAWDIFFIPRKEKKKKKETQRVVSFVNAWSLCSLLAISAAEALPLFLLLFFFLKKSWIPDATWQKSKCHLHFCCLDIHSGPVRQAVHSCLYVCVCVCVNLWLYVFSPPAHLSLFDRTCWPQLLWQPGNHGTWLWHSWLRLIGLAAGFLPGHL